MAVPHVPLHLTGRVLLDDAREAGELFVRDGRAQFAPPALQAGAMRHLEGFVVPGLVDVHSHLGLGPQGTLSLDAAAGHALADRDAGVLLVRDAGSPLDVSPLQDRPELPRMLRSGRHIARPKRYHRGAAWELGDVAELPEAVYREARSGDGWVKVVGDWIDRAVGDLTPLWPGDLLARAVALAHDEAARVTVHAFAAETVDDLIAAEVDGIDHGTGITADQAERIAALGIPVTPTLLQVERFPQLADRAAVRYPAFAKRLRALHERRFEQVRMLHEAGVPLLVGTDAGGSLAHGRIADECALLVAAGVPASDVVAAASWRARHALGFGGLEDGASADLVVYPADPREDIGVLRFPTAVVLRGEIVAGSALAGR